MKRCTVDAFGAIDEFTEEEIEYEVTNGTLIISCTTDKNEWTVDIAYPPGSWRKMQLRYIDPSEVDEKAEPTR